MPGRFAIGLVLLVAGAAKLRQPAWPATARAFGAPRWLVPVLPWVELTMGALLLAGIGLPWTARSALAMLAAFTAIVARKLHQGDAAPCGCFGEATPRPVDSQTLRRNLMLCLLAALAGVDPGYGGGVGALTGLGIGALVLARPLQWSSARR